ncbi:MAG: hypothetical protein DDT19_02758 [Syntrophomonadaceae bacterium]|nr:hypothetical protein [Bacillota bacterium]
MDMATNTKEQIPKVSVGMPWVWVILNSVYVSVVSTPNLSTVIENGEVALVSI